MAEGLQLSLQLDYDPRDRGKLNSLQNIIASISDELRKQAPIAQELVGFTTNELPQIILNNVPLELKQADPDASELLSPYKFEVLDFIKPNTRPLKGVFSQVSEVVKNIEDIEELAKSIQGAELIGIDESIVPSELSVSNLTFLRSVAFRMYKLPNDELLESVGPVLSELRMQKSEDAAFENEIKLLGYIRNNFIAYVSAITAIASGRSPFVVLHGPLVRTIGGFSHLTFDYETARDLLNIDLADAGEFELPKGKSPNTIQGDDFTANNLSFEPNKVLKGDDNLRQFNNFCLKSCRRKCARTKAFSDKAVPPSQTRVTDKMMRTRRYPGFCLYFWVLRSLVDLCRLSKETTVSSVVEDISRATEMTRLLFPSLLTVTKARKQVEQTLNNSLKAVGIKYPKQKHQRNELYEMAKRTVKNLRLSDSGLFSWMLSEGQYTTPVQIYRYRTETTFKNALADDSQGIRHEFEDILNALFPAKVDSNSHPGYRVLMSYVRTTPLREPVRIEYFDLPHFYPPKKILGPIYLMSLPYQQYGLPLILYYADKLAHTPTKLVKTIIEEEYINLVLQNRFSDPVSYMRILGHLNRGYFQRDGGLS